MAPWAFYLPHRYARTALTASLKTKRVGQLQSRTLLIHCCTWHHDSALDQLLRMTCEIWSQISAALLSEDQRLKLPRFLEEEEKDPEATKQASLSCLVVHSGGLHNMLGLRPACKDFMKRSFSESLSMLCFLSVFCQGCKVLECSGAQ